MKNLYSKFYSTRMNWLIPSSIILFGLILRLFHLDAQGLWYDEAFSVTRSNMALAEMTRELIRDFVHPPLHYYVLHIWLNIFGFSIFSVRLLSVLFGVLSILIIYLLARYLYDTKTAILSALLLSVSQLGIMYSQEIRPYTQLLFFVLLTSYFFIVSLRRNVNSLWWVFVGSATLMIYTHYYGIFVFISLIAFGFIFRKRYHLSIPRLIGSIILPLLSFAPWALSGIIEQALTQSKTLPSEQAPWFAASWRSIFYTINQFNNGKPVGLLNHSPRWTYLIGSVLFVIPLLLTVKPFFRKQPSSELDRRDKENFIFLSLLWIPPVLILIALGALINLQYDVRYVLHSIAPYYILVAYGISLINIPILRRLIVILIIMYSVISLRSNYFIPYKENYRDALVYLADEYEIGDCTVFPPFGDLPLQWSINHKDHPGLTVLNLDELETSNFFCDRVWVVAYRRVAWAIAENEKWERIVESNYVKEDLKEYFWINVALYVPP